MKTLNFTLKYDREAFEEYWILNFYLKDGGWIKRDNHGSRKTIWSILL
jgi:hypothetical protein